MARCILICPAGTCVGWCVSVCVCVCVCVCVLTLTSRAELQHSTRSQLASNTVLGTAVGERGRHWSTSLYPGSLATHRSAWLRRQLPFNKTPLPRDPSLWMHTVGRHGVGIHADGSDEMCAAICAKKQTPQSTAFSLHFG